MEVNAKINEIIKNLKPEELKEFNRIYYGREDHLERELSKTTLEEARKLNLDIKAYGFEALREETKPQRKVRIGIIQHSIVLPTSEPIEDQRAAIFEKVEKIINLAAAEGVNVLCLQEIWTMPFFLCTGEKEKWSEFAETIGDGPTSSFITRLARLHKMVIVSPILENDNGIWWNTAFIADHEGRILGKHRKNHLPSVGSYAETAYYCPGDLGHPVFETKYGKIAVNICYGRHQALNWMMLGLNGAEIVFNPSATTSQFGESFWTVEARNAAVANSFFTCSINRVGTEVFEVEKEGETSTVTREFYGTSHVTAPDGSRTPALSRNMDGLLIADVDLNLCRQMKDRWGFNMTARLDLYAESLNKVVKERSS